MSERIKKLVWIRELSASEIVSVDPKYGVFLHKDSAPPAPIAYISSCVLLSSGMNIAARIYYGVFYSPASFGVAIDEYGWLVVVIDLDERCRFLKAAKAIINERHCLEWGYVPFRGIMGYYWKGQWVGGDTVDDAIHFIADRIDDSQPQKSTPCDCSAQGRRTK
jgi:hypothetical protein